MADTSKDEIIALLMKELYSKGGYLPLIEFDRLLNNYVPTNASKWVSQNPKYFKIVNNENGNVFLLGLTPVTFCKNHASKADSCLTCDGLHVCKFFALGDSCKFGAQCNFSHNFETVHNRGVLKKHHLQHLDELELKCLFQKLENRCDVTIPTICKYFNKGCCLKKNCTFLHICKHYLMNNCTFGKKCKISHNLDERNINILKMFGIKFPSVSKALAQLKSLYNCEIDKLTFERTMKKTNTICLHNLSLRQCSFKDTCRYYHKEMPYQWQFKLNNNDNEWRDFDATLNEKIEEKYCSLENETHIINTQEGKAKFQFDTMKYFINKQEYLLYRLSTVSNKSDPRCPLATTWIWYWKDKNNIWNEYGSPSDRLINVTNEDIEKSYLDNPEGIMVIQTNDNSKGEINFLQMFQKIKYESKVIRRPKFISREAAAELRQKSFKSIPKLNLNNATQQNNLPSNWEIPEDETEISSHYKITMVDETSKEYKTVSDQFNAPAIKAVIIKIERIENGNLWEYYNWKKMKMTKESGQDIKELNLFHGTEMDSVGAICKQGFDVRLSGIGVGCKYGKGIYFAKDAASADSYIIPVKEEYKIILAKILVGEFVVGNSAYVRPPPMNLYEKGGKLYDSCVDSIKEPKLFVIFANDQTYPAYIITYKKSKN